MRVRALRIFLDHFAQRGEGPTRGLRGALIEVDAEPALQEVRFPLEIGEAFDVVGVVEARMGRVLADEGVRLVERGFGLAAAVVGVDEIEAGLAGLGGERIACDERFIDADRAVEILVVKAAAGALVDAPAAFTRRASRSGASITLRTPYVQLSPTRASRRLRRTCSFFFACSLLRSSVGSASAMTTLISTSCSMLATTSSTCCADGTAP